MEEKEALTVMAIRLTCRIPQEAHTQLMRVALDMNLKKGKTMVVLMELARGQHAHAVNHYNGGDDKACTLNAAEDWLVTYQNYRRHYGLLNNTDFFRDCLLRGLSIHLAGNPHLV